MIDTNHSFWIFAKVAWLDEKAGVMQCN